MTYFKLALRNARRQTRDYLIYFSTVILATALMYSFNALIFSPEVQALSNRLSALPLTIALASIVVVCIFGWLVSYMTRFMLARRSRELGTYLLIGLENRQVAWLFFGENLTVGGMALVLGILLGNLLFQVLWAIVLALFHKPYQFAFSFSFKTLGLTLAYFVFIYLFAQLKCSRYIRSMKIYDLIYFDRQNEVAAFQTGKTRRRTFLVSIVLGILGTFMLMAGNLTSGIVGAAFVIAFLYGFFVSFSSGVPAYFEKHTAQKYRGQTLLVFRTLSAKLSTMGVVMATIALLFTATLISEGTGMIFHTIFENRAEQNAGFDLLVSTGDSDKPEYTFCRDYMEINWPICASREYSLYLAETATVTDYVAANTEYYRYYDKDTLLRWSDYTALREMLGYAPITLEPGRYLIHCEPYLATLLEKWDTSISIDGQDLQKGGLYTEALAQYLYNMNGYGFTLVVPDEYIENRPVRLTLYAALTEYPVSESQYNDLSDQLRNASSMGMSLGDSDMLLYCKTIDQNEAVSMITMMVFPLFYLAIVLTMTAASILTVQQLSETDHYRHQFELLRKLGMCRRDMMKVLRRQMAIYYALPAVPPILIAVPFLLNLSIQTMVESSHPIIITCIALGLFFLIYAIYILMAHSSLKRRVIPE